MLGAFYLPTAQVNPRAVRSLSMGRQVNSTLSVRRQPQGDRLGEDQELVKAIPDSCRLSWRSHTESRCPSGFPCHRALHQARSARQPRQRSRPLAANGDVRWDVRIGGDYPQLMWIVRCRALSRRPQSNHRNCDQGVGDSALGASLFRQFRFDLCQPCLSVMVHNIGCWSKEENCDEYRNPARIGKTGGASEK